MALLGGFGIAAILGLIFKYVMLFFALRTLKVILVKAIIIGVMVSLTVGLFLTCKNLIDSVGLVAPPLLDQAFSMFLPSNTSTCFTVISSTYIASWVYRWKLHFINMFDGVI